jgi:LytTr DNA-binding domain
MTGAVASNTMNTSEPLQPATARKVFRRQMAVFAVFLAANATSNVFTEIADSTRHGVHLPVWEPITWEFSSVLCTWLLIPAVGWWLTQFPVARLGWPRNVPAHLLATLPFSLMHVAGMVALRDLVYGLLGAQYHFGRWWPSWLYEYRKDFVSYWIISFGIVSFRLYGLWSDSRSARPSAATETEILAGAPPPERLVVRKLNREYILSVSDIDRIEADGNYVTVHAQGTAYPRRESLIALEKRLDGRRFVRVHRGHLINVDRIREIQPWDHGDYRIVLHDGSCVNLSRRYRSRLDHLLR